MRFKVTIEKSGERIELALGMALDAEEALAVELEELVERNAAGLFGW